MHMIHKLLTLILLLFLRGAGMLMAGEPSKNDRDGSIIKNGDFEQADAQDPIRPAGWNKPDGLGVRWMEAPGDTNLITRGKAICLNTAISEKAMVAQWQGAGISEWNIPKPSDGPVAATYGLSFYSDTLPVVSGRVYRLTFDFRGDGGAKVWVRGYGIWNGEKRRRWEVIVNCPPSTNQWTELSRDINPTRRTPEVTEMKVMLYAYWPPGVYWFDHVRLIPISAVDAP
jgi:hypothetical protein